MDKDAGRYCYETYPSVTKTNTNSLKLADNTGKMKKKKEIKTCNCLSSKKRKAFFTGLATNVGICILLFGYTLIGSVVFLAIEGGNSIQHHILATTSMATNLNYKKQQPSSNNGTYEFKSKADDIRAKTVENIWDITVNLNILYRDNWTRLAAQEITRFQDELLKSLSEDYQEYPVVERKISGGGGIVSDNYEWNFARSFLYSLTVLTTIGYGSLAPRTNLGKAVTMGYAILGIPLTLLYLSSIGSILSRIARGVFSRALCCCLCSNCGYCCYDEKRMAEKERRMRKKRQQIEMQQQMGLQEPFYVRSNANFSGTTTTTGNSLHSPSRDFSKDTDSLSCTDNESKTSMHGLSILAPILLCLASMFIYICIGTFVLYRLEHWHLLDGFYFCFMSLTTIGFGNMVPGSDPFEKTDSSTTIWFCSFYIMLGMALTAMCFNVVHDEIVHRLKHEEKVMRKLNSTAFNDELGPSDPYIAS